MLFVYARHTPDCDHRDDPKYRRCRCPKWIDGYVDNQRLRQSAKTRSWEKAELTARSIQEAADPMKAAQPAGPCDQWSRGALAGNLQLAVNSQHYSLGNTERPVPPSVSCFRAAPTEYTWLVFEHTSNRSLT